MACKVGTWFAKLLCVSGDDLAGFVRDAVAGTNRAADFCGLAPRCARTVGLETAGFAGNRDAVRVITPGTGNVEDATGVEVSTVDFKGAIVSGGGLGTWRLGGDTGPPS